VRASKVRTCVCFECRYSSQFLATRSVIDAGEVYRLADPPAVLKALDEIEGFRSSEPARSLYLRTLTDVTLDDGRIQRAWAYFYNAPLGRAERIVSGDYLDHLNGNT
jgi:gamma-glutamylcyclotransferase (GGCT)/AIG2-like uncharacterized protein YtfP